MSVCPAFAQLMSAKHAVGDVCLMSLRSSWATLSSHQSITVLAVSKCVKHDKTWNTVLKHVEVEFWCGLRRCDTGTQCWVQKSMSRLPILVLECSKGGHLEGGAMPNRTEKWLFERENVDEIGWNSHGRIKTPWPAIPTGIHPPGPPALWESMQKPCVRVERLLPGYVPWSSQKRATGW